METLLTSAPQGAASTRAPVAPVPFTAVACADSFWAPRIEINRAVTVPFAFDQCERSGRIDLFRRAARTLAGDATVDRTPPGFPFDDTDLYKVIEAASYTLNVHPDPALEAYVDGLIELIAAAQEPDGYLYTSRTIGVQPPHWMMGDARWVVERVHSHELYNLGHLYEAAAAHYQATGKRTLLDVALRTVALLDATFGPGKRSIWPGHPITEMALVKLQRALSDGAGPSPDADRLIDLAAFLLDERGPDGEQGAGVEYNQSHRPLVDQAEAVGHAVRAAYLYAGMADVAAVTGDARWIGVMQRLWQDVVGRKLYITGGIGATHHEEAFGAAYELPNDTAYAETCAAIANVFWNHRLFLLHADARYIDVLERSLYNGLLSGVSLDGQAFFYDNPLESDGWHERSPWFGCACCPSNMARFLPSLPGYLYATQGDTLYVNLFVGGRAQIELGGRTVRLTQETDYPWQGAVRLTVEPDRPGAFELAIRIPGWARNEAVPGDLYRFTEPLAEGATLTVNGAPVEVEVERGYARLARAWQAGDMVELTLPMPVRRVMAHKRIEADRERVALQRGPLVYCVEWADNPAGGVRSLLLPDDAPLRAEFAPDLLGGVIVIRGSAQTPRQSAAQEFTAIPYYAWANRGPGEMIVWMRAVRAGRH